jgi:hypothetical protein
MNGLQLANEAVSITTDHTWFGVDVDLNRAWLMIDAQTQITSGQRSSGQTGSRRHGPEVDTSS